MPPRAKESTTLGKVMDGWVYEGCGFAEHTGSHDSVDFLDLIF